MKKIKLTLTILVLASLTLLNAQSKELIVDAKNVGAEIQPTMYGLFFEDINYAADGGLYAELIKNRSFEFPQNFMGWNTYGNITLMDDGPFDKNPHYIRLGNPDHPRKYTGVENEGFFGIGLKKNESYRFSVWARVFEGDEPQSISVELIDIESNDEQQLIVSAKLELKSKEWKKYEVVMKSTQTIPDAKLRIFLTSEGILDLEHISLFPINTWNNHKNGLRKDIAQALADLNPGVFRFPGGCIVEGADLETRYNWKNSIGDVENRPLNENRWLHTFKHRFYPDYYQSYGLGFYEYFLFSEEIGAEPIPIVNCGLACQFQNVKEEDHACLDELGQYIQDALDLIEFANGGIDTEWGGIRAQMGHPEPFNLKYIGVGNEQWGEEYVIRLKYFVDKIREVYPEIKIIGGSGPGSEGEEFDYLWPEMKKIKVDLVDEHFYRPEKWFLNQGARYDSYDRNGPKVFAGEYACHGAGKKWNHFNASLMEAGFMTGLERNADIVHMATYAPLLAHVKGWQWRPDLIWFDNLDHVKTASYYVQQLFSQNMGSNVIPLTYNGKPLTGAVDQDGLFASAVWDDDTKEYIVKVVNTSTDPQKLKINFSGLGRKDILVDATCITLESADLTSENTIEDPLQIVPQEQMINSHGNVINAEIKANTFAIYKIKKVTK